MKIYQYKKVHDEYTTYRMQGDEVQELCTLSDGYTYVCGPDVLPAQSAKLIIKEIILTEELRAEIKAVSPQVRLINSRVVEKIREKYDLNNELKQLRTAITEITAYTTYVEDCISWGDTEKAKLGL